MLLIHYLQLNCRQSGAKLSLISRNISKREVVCQWSPSDRPIDYPRCGINACEKWGLECSSLIHVLYTPPKWKQKIQTLLYVSWKEMNLSHVFSFLFFSAASHWLMKWVFFPCFYSMICYALGGQDALLCQGVPPSSTTGRLLWCCWYSLFPWRVNKFHLLIVEEFPCDLHQGRILCTLQRVCFLVTEQFISSCSCCS